jgi:hypothetical protein
LFYSKCQLYRRRFAVVIANSVNLKAAHTVVRRKREGCSKHKLALYVNWFVVLPKIWDEFTREGDVLKFQAPSLEKQFAARTEQRVSRWK